MVTSGDDVNRIETVSNLEFTFIALLKVFHFNGNKLPTYLLYIQFLLT